MRGSDWVRTFDEDVNITTVYMWHNATRGIHHLETDAAVNGGIIFFWCGVLVADRRAFGNHNIIAARALRRNWSISVEWLAMYCVLVMPNGI